MYSYICISKINERISELCVHFNNIPDKEEIKMAQLERSIFKSYIRNMNTAESFCFFYVHLSSSNKTKTIRPTFFYWLELGFSLLLVHLCMCKRL